MEIIVYQHSQSLCSFVDVNLLFFKQSLQVHCVEHVAILMSSMQCVEGYMVTLKNLDY